jgi:hypothetical protein
VIRAGIVGTYGIARCCPVSQRAELLAKVRGAALDIPAVRNEESGMSPSLFTYRHEDPNALTES